MISVDEALTLVLEQVRPLAKRRVPIVEACGYEAPTAIVSDIDSPPHDKSVVDGYAIRYADLRDGVGEFRVVEEVTAGMVPTRAVEPGCASRVMTGAPIAAGADTVVMVERSTPLAGDRVRLDEAKAKHGQHIVRLGAVMRRGDIVIPAGTLLTPAAIGLAAEAGCATIEMPARPQVAILATGNELVPADQVPQPGQIRNSNGPMLAALCSSEWSEPIDLGIARDEREALRAKIVRGLEADVLLLSGGVSAGVLDLVPGVLRELGVREVFHKVHMKPGKPLWFGAATSQEGRTTLVFGLPGNPVSTLVCYELFVRPAIEALRGVERPEWDRVGRLTKSFTHKGDRPTYWPARWDTRREPEFHFVATPLDWQGSGDLRTLAFANCLIAFEAGTRKYEAGEEVELLLLT